jgi:mycothiol synthase
MAWPRQRLNTPPEILLPAGYELRNHRPGDEAGFYRVMELAGFQGWNDETLHARLPRILPNGWFIVAHQASGEIVATAMATHCPSLLHPGGGELGWVAGHPHHSGRGLGLAVCAAVTAYFLAADYDDIYLRTDDWRLPAIKTYLKLGYIPFLHASDMEGRWRAVCYQLNWPFTPHDWPKENTFP